MKKILAYATGGLIIWSLVAASVMAQGITPVSKYTLWIGNHYTDFADYRGKVGEYDRGQERWLPEFILEHVSRGEGQFTSFKAHYFDENNILGTLTSRVGSRFQADFRYRSSVPQKGQDLLANLETREAINGNPGGKILTHEILDPGAHYNVHRRELEGRLDYLVSPSHNVKFMAAHKTTLQSGTEQKTSANHCFSCHVTSNGVKVEKVIHQLTAGLQGDFGKHTAGYEFAYRSFESKTMAPTAYYDEAKHPVNGGSGAEFTSRQNFSDTSLPYGTYPRTEKVQHKVRFKGPLGSGDYATSLSFSKSFNRDTDLDGTSWVGSVSYAYPLDVRTRLIAKLIGTKLDVDEVFVDVPTYRRGRPGPQSEFDFTRYSSLNRFDLRGSLEVIRRFNEKVTGSVLLGYDNIARDDYPVHDEGLTTSRFTGEIKVRYRKGLRYSTAIKYRMEKTTDPFTSGRGLFEARGRDILNPPAANFAFVFYYQREDLRYQNITTQPTLAHIFEWESSWKPDKAVNVNLGLKGKYDKNGDLDSLDVNHLMIQPHLALNYMPNPRWSLALGTNYSHAKARGPVAVALFDG